MIKQVKQNDLIRLTRELARATAMKVRYGIVPVSSDTVKHVLNVPSLKLFYGKQLKLLPFGIYFKTRSKGIVIPLISIDDSIIPGPPLKDGKEVDDSLDYEKLFFFEISDYPHRYTLGSDRFIEIVARMVTILFYEDTLKRLNDLEITPIGGSGNDFPKHAPGVRMKFDENDNRRRFEGDLLIRLKGDGIFYLTQADFSVYPTNWSKWNDLFGPVTVSFKNVRVGNFKNINVDILKRLRGKFVDILAHVTRGSFEDLVDGVMKHALGNDFQKLPDGGYVIRNLKPYKGSNHAPERVEVFIIYPGWIVFVVYDDQKKNSRGEYVREHLFDSLGNVLRSKLYVDVFGDSRAGVRLVSLNRLNASEPFLSLSAFSNFLEELHGETLSVLFKIVMSIYKG